MVDQGTQYNIADTGEPQPVPETPSTSTQLEDDLNQSFLSDSTMEIDDDEDDDDPDYEPDFDMEVSDNEERLVIRFLVISTVTYTGGAA